MDDGLCASARVLLRIRKSNKDESPPCPQQTEKPFRNPKEAMAQFESQICDE
jgi:hypothetical protein